MQDTILITGGSGFVGRALARLPGAESRIRWLRRDSAGGFGFDGAHGASTLIHLAWPNLRASASSGAGSDDDEGTWRRFVDSSIRLRQACDVRGITFVGIGSGIEACDEAQLREPYLTYTRRKTELRTALENGVASPLSWVRLHFLFGMGESPDRLVPAAIRAAITGTAFACAARDRRRHWLAVDDLAVALHAFALRPLPGVWDIAGRAAHSFDELFALIGEAVGKPVHLTEPLTLLADTKIELVAATQIAPHVSPALGLSPNLLSRLKEYAVEFGAPRGDDGA